MTEYIPRSEAIAELRHRCYPCGEGIEAINGIPAADVVLVIHARWIEYQIPPIICCSNCDWATGIEEKNFQHCPNCGAKMD